MKMMSENEINDATKKAMDAIRDLTEKGTQSNLYTITTCIICDHILGQKNRNKISGSTLNKRKTFLTGEDDLPTGLRKCYQYKGKHKLPVMEGMLLSPCAKATKTNKAVSFSCCTECKEHLENSKSKG